MSASEKKIILEMKKITKNFPGVKALDTVDFDLREGEVHALLGENGAGKSTLIKILAGIYPLDSGEIIMNGEKCEMRNVHVSQAKGISVIHQELILVPNMTVAENIFLGREVGIGNSEFVNDSIMNKKAQELLDRLGVKINCKDKISQLSTAQQQMVEIAKALAVDAKIIVMDEPTASLTEKETSILFDLIKKLKEKDISSIYISHRMEELFKISDRVTVLRDGKCIGTKITSGTTKSELIEMMVGRKLNEFYKSTTHASGEIVFEVKNLNKKGVLKDINFSLKSGEILGVSGIVGAGRTELARAVFGVDKIDSGAIYVEGKQIKINSPFDAIKYGIALVPESRKDYGLFLQKGVGYNITLQVLQKFIKFIFNDNRTEYSIVSKFINQLSIKTTSSNQMVNKLSGGNQQKIVIAKWLATSPKILILDEPTRGVDVGAKTEIYSIINELARSGVGIIMISSELPEIVNVSDRVLVMYNGQITGRLNKNDIDQKTIMLYATGNVERNKGV